MTRRIHTFKSFLDEDRAQMELPFDDKHPIHDKPTHVHVIDALESLNTMKDAGKYYSREVLEDEWDKAYQKAFEIYKKNLGTSDASGNDPDMDFVKDKWADASLWSESTRSYIERLEHKFANYKDYIMAMERLGAEDALTHAGTEALEKERKRAFDYNLHRNGIKNSVEKMYHASNKGLIDIWRAVLIRKSEEANDVYEDITKKFGGLGFYWSWKEDGAIVYHMANRGGLHVKLHGKARVEDIDWVSTIYKASYFLNNEDEISLIENDGLVMIEEMTILNKVIRLESPAVVPTGRYVFHGAHPANPDL